MVSCTWSCRRTFISHLRSEVAISPSALLSNPGLSALGNVDLPRSQRACRVKRVLCVFPGHPVTLFASWKWLVTILSMSGVGDDR